MTAAAVAPPVLSRDVASAVIIGAASRAGSALAAAVLVLAFPVLLELYSTRGILADAVTPTAALIVMLSTQLVVIWRPTPLTLTIHLLLGTLAIGAYLWSILTLHPEFAADASYLLVRPGVALVFAGTIGARPWLGVALGIVGFALAVIPMASVYWELGLGPIPWEGVVFGLATYAPIFVLLGVVRSVQRRRVPDFRRFQQQTRERQAQRLAELHAISVVHDTVLNDLTRVINGDGTLDSRTRALMRRDIQKLTEVSRTVGATNGAALASADARFRNELMTIVRDFQWRGLSVDVTGNTNQPVQLTEAVERAVLGAIGACLQNVLSHSGATSAELTVAATETDATVMIVDAGSGFDPALVASDRLGISSSVKQRIEAVSGTVRVFSTEGAGTSVIIRVPRDVGAPDER